MVNAIFLEGLRSAGGRLLEIHGRSLRDAYLTWFYPGGRQRVLFSPQRIGICAAVSLTAALLTFQFASSHKPLASAVANDEIVVAYAEPTDVRTADEQKEADRLTISFQVQRGDTLATLFATAGIDRKEADRAVAAIREVFDPRKLNIGNEVTVALIQDTDGRYRLQGVMIWLGGERYIEAVRTGSGQYAAQRTSQPAITEEPANIADLLNIDINRGDTLATLLSAAGVSAQEIDRSVRALRQQFNPKKLRIEHEIFLSLNSGAELLGFALKLADGKFITVTRDSNGRYSARRTVQPTLPKAMVNKTATSSASGEPATAPEDEIAVTPEEDPKMIADLPDKTSESWMTPYRASGVHSTNSGNPIETAPGPTATIALERGDTLMEALLRGGATNGDAHNSIAAFKQILNPAQASGRTTGDACV